MAVNEGIDRNMNTKLRNLAVLSLSAALVLSACAYPQDASSDSVAAASLEIATDEDATAHADDDQFDRERIFEEATVIIEGTVLPPEVGSIRDAKEAEPSLDSASIAITPVSVRVDKVHRGNVEVGAEVTVLKHGGVIKGPGHQGAPEESPSGGQQYLLFGSEYSDGALRVLGGSAGVYVAEGAEVFVSTDSDGAAFAQITRAEVEKFTAQK